MLLRPAALMCALLAVAAAFASCGGDDDTTVGTPRATAMNTRPAYTGPMTGVTQLDQVIGTAVTGTDIDLAAITGYSRVACEAAPADASVAPACRPSEDAGTQVEVLPAFNCARTWVRPEQVPDAYREALAGDRHILTSAYRPVPLTLGIEADYVAVILTGDATAAALFVKDGRIVAVERACQNNVAALTDGRVAESLYTAP